MIPNDLAALERVPFPLDDVTGRVALVGCGKQKLAGPVVAVRAEHLYTGAYFKEVLAACKARYDHVFILSALYGVVGLDVPVTTYEIKLPWSGMNSENYRVLRDFVVRCHLPLQTTENRWPVTAGVDIHAGRNYARWFPHTSSATVRWADWGSIGYRRQKYRSLR